MASNFNGLTKPVSKSETFKETFENWVDETTAHGLPRIVHSNHITIRIMWTLFFLASFGYCLSTIIRSIIQFTQYETVAQLTVVRNSPTEFPAITVCNLNPYNYNFYFADIDALLVKYGLAYDIDWNNFKHSGTCREALDEYFLKIKRIIANYYKNKTISHKVLGFDLKTYMLMSCTFNKQSCTSDNFSYFWSNEYGNCYTFNGGKNALNAVQSTYTTSLSGPSYGFQLELLVGDPSKPSKFLIKNGISLMVHNQSTPIEMLTEGIDVPAGQDTYVAVTRTFMNKLSSPYSNCINDLEKYKRVSDYSMILYGYMKQLKINDYYEELCYKLCLQDQIINECNCGDLNVPLLKDVNYCQNNTELDCMTNVSMRFSQSTYEKECHYSCPTQCNGIKYDLSSHSALYPSSFYYDQLILSARNIPYFYGPYFILSGSHYTLLGQGFTIDQILQRVRENVVKITVNYNDLTYTTIEETPSMTFDTLLGVLGGQLGLFIGISLLSLVEFFELVIKFIILYRKKRLEHTQPPNNLTNVNQFFY